MMPKADAHAGRHAALGDLLIVPRASSTTRALGGAESAPPSCARARRWIRWLSRGGHHGCRHFRRPSTRLAGDAATVGADGRRCREGRRPDRRERARWTTTPRSPASSAR